MPSKAVAAGRDRTSTRSSLWMFAAIIAAAVAIVSYPNIHGFWGRDDFACIALARMIGAPWQLFVTDHFFVAGAVFRPLGFFSEWLCIKLFGTTYAPNAAFDIAMHAAVALCLFRVMRRPSIPPVIAALGALLFALHPATVGPSLWWSGRFDLQSTLFILLAVMAALRYRDRGTAASLACALLAALAAILSKENGLVAVAALTAIWGRWMFLAPAQRTRAQIAIALSWLVAIGFFLWRRCVLGTFSSAFTGSVSVGDAIRQGLMNWLNNVSGYLSFFPHLTTVEIVLIALGCVAALLAIFTARWGSKTQREPWDVDTLLLGLLFFISPIVMQAPIAAFGSPLSADMSAIEAGMQSRLYYLQTAGLMLLLVTAIGPLYRAAASLPRMAIASSMTLVIATFAWASHGNAEEFGRRSSEIAVPARALVDAVETLPIPNRHCHIAFLGYAPPPEWGVYVSVDSIVKGLSARKQIRRCWIHSDTPTFFRMQPAPADAADALPFQPLRIQGVEAPWRRLGKVVFAYLAAPDEVAMADPAMLYFAMKDGRFVDVTADVRAGRIRAGLK